MLSSERLSTWLFWDRVSVAQSSPDRLGYCTPQNETSLRPHCHNLTSPTAHFLLFLLCCCHLSPQLWVTNVDHPFFFVFVLIFSWVLGTELRTSYSQGKHFTSWINSAVLAAVVLVAIIRLDSLWKVMASMVPWSCWTFAASPSNLSPQQVTPGTLPQPAGSPYSFKDGSFTQTLSCLAPGRSHQPLT